MQEPESEIEEELEVLISPDLEKEKEEKQIADIENLSRHLKLRNLYIKRKKSYRGVLISLLEILLILGAIFAFMAVSKILIIGVYYWVATIFVMLYIYKFMTFFWEDMGIKYHIHDPRRTKTEKVLDAIEDFLTRHA